MERAQEYMPSKLLSEFNDC